jgi:hypothetical protein
MGDASTLNAKSGIPSISFLLFLLASTLRSCLVPGDWLNGIGVERGVCHVRERLASWN